jgi:hypothetical protein
MKIKPKMKMAFGDSITAAYEAWGECRGERIAQWASNPRLALVQEQPYFLNSSAKGRSV